MRIKSQYSLSIIIFGIILAIISASVIITNEQVTQVSNEEQTTNNISTDASNFAYISNAYFLTKQNAQVTLWQNQYSLVSSELSGLKIGSPEKFCLRRFFMKQNFASDKTSRKHWLNVISWLRRLFFPSKA